MTRLPLLALIAVAVMLGGVWLYGESRYKAGKADCQAKYTEIEKLTVIEQARDRDEVDRKIEKYNNTYLDDLGIANDWLW